MPATALVRFAGSTALFLWLAGVVLDTVGEEKLYQDLIRLPNGDTMEIMGNIVEEGRRPEGDGATGESQGDLALSEPFDV